MQVRNLTALQMLDFLRQHGDGLALDLGFTVLVHERALEHDLVSGSLLGDGDGRAERLARPRLLGEAHAVRREVPDPHVVRHRGGVDVAERRIDREVRDEAENRACLGALKTS